MTRRWSVESRDAYRAWVERRRPSFADEMDLSRFLDGWHDGPPAPEEIRGENRRVTGPNGEDIWYRQFDADAHDSLAGYVFVLGIR